MQQLNEGLRSGDQIDFWVKDVVQKKGDYRIILTVNPDSIDPVKKSWQSLKDGIEGQTLDYSYEKGSMKMTLPDGQTISVSVSSIFICETTPIMTIITTIGIIAIFLFTF